MRRNSGGPRSGTQAALIVVLGAFALSGCATYGQFDENEPGIEESLLGGVFGVLGTPEEEPIDYSTRPPLVAPPTEGALPAPQATALAADDPQWPQGAAARQAQVIGQTDEMLIISRDGTVDLEATERLGQRRALDEDPDSFDGDLMSRDEVEAVFAQNEARQIAAAQSAQNPAQRRFLTDPPSNLRVPAEGAEYIPPEEEDEGGFSWWPF